MRLAKRAALVLVSFVVLAYIMIEVGHVLRFGHFAPLGLHADAIVRKADYGIPGISKVYEPRLSNLGIAPATVMICRVKEDWDSPTYVMRVGNAIERWDPKSEQWKNIFSDEGKSFACAHATPRRLWPFQSLSGGEVAVAAYEMFSIGDHGRFVIFADNRKTISTAPFIIDEHQTVEGVSFRVR